MKRVLIFSLTYYPDLVGGAEIPIRKTTDRFDPKEVEFDMVTLRFNSALPETEKIGNVTVHRVGFAKHNPRIGELVQFPLKLNKYLFPFFAFPVAERLHKERKYDVVWSVMTSYASFAALFFKLMHPSVKYLFTLNDGDPIEYLKAKARFVYPLFVMLFTKADLIHAPSTYLAKFAKDMGYKREPVLIPNALDIEDFLKEPLPSEVEAARTRLSKKAGDVFLITTSRLVKKNAVDDVIRALPHLPENVSFKILGKGPDLEMLQALAKELGVEERVSFLGHVDMRELPAMLRAADIFIRPSLSEGMGNSPIEAMAAGIPVIGTQEGGLADSIIDPDRNTGQQATAYAVDARDPEGIARQVTRIMEHPEEARKIAAYAKQFAATTYDSARIDKEMKENVFGKLFC